MATGLLYERLALPPAVAWVCACLAARVVALFAGLDGALQLLSSAYDLERRLDDKTSDASAAHSTENTSASRSRLTSSEVILQQWQQPPQQQQQKRQQPLRMRGWWGDPPLLRCMCFVLVVTSAYGFQPADKQALKTAVDAWCSHSATAATIYGDINTWDVRTAYAPILYEARHTLAHD